MTAELLTRCREVLKASDETAKAASPGPWLVDGNQVQFIDSGDRILVVRHTWPQEAAHIAANDPATRLALNAALRTVLDGIVEALTMHESAAKYPVGARTDCMFCGGSAGPWPCPDHQRATASLAAIATALGVQEADRG